MVATATRITSESSPRTVKGPNMAILHHAATTSLSGIESLMEPGGRVVSAHWAVKDGNRVRKVNDDRRGWSLGDAFWDSKSTTVECANESVIGWTVSRASEESIAQIIADSARRFGWYPHRNGDPKTWTVIGHREVYTIHGGSYATACPGGMNLNWITGRAQQLLGGGSTTIIPASPAPPKPEPRKGHTMHIIRTTDGEIGLMTDNGYARIPNVPQVQLFERMLRAWPNIEEFNARERDEMRAVIHAANTADDAETERILARLEALPPATVDAAALADAVSESVSALLAEQGVEIDAMPIIAAIREATAAIAALDIPTAAENGQAARAAIVR